MSGCALVLPVEEVEATLPSSGETRSESVAWRLAAALWGATPDAVLLGAAMNDELNEPYQVSIQARRMLLDARADAMIARFHEQHFEFAPMANRSTSATLAAAATTEDQRFVQHIVRTKHGSYADLLSSTETFINPELAEIYGIDEAVDASALVALPPAERSGILTHLRFLTSYSTPSERGATIARHIACATIDSHAQPPPHPSYLDSAGKPRTRRHALEESTAAEPCARCHRVVNGLGYGLEHYDPAGRYRTVDASFPIDSSGEYLVNDEYAPFNGALELSTLLSQNVDVHTCYLRRWLEFLVHRPANEADAAIVAELARRSQRDRLPVEDLIVELLASPAFLDDAQ
jgi:hypothetical protein